MFFLLKARPVNKILSAGRKMFFQKGICNLREGGERVSGILWAANLMFPQSFPKPRHTWSSPKDMPSMLTILLNCSRGKKSKQPTERVAFCESYDALT